MNLRKPLMSVNDALTFLLNAARPLKELESLSTLAAAGRVLAQSQTSLLDVPPMDNTQMDGYAVRAADCVGGQATLRITQRIPAGHVGEPLLAGTAARIFTGAMIPVGADAVVMQEQCVADGDDVMINHVPRAGEWIRRRGLDGQTGATILHAGTRLRAQEIGLAASVGLASLPVWRKMKAAVFFAGEELEPGAIYNSNRFTLSALLHDLGCEVTDYGIVPDTLEATRATLRLAAQGHDLVLTSGGVSVGEEDHIRPAVEAEGSLTMWQIAVKPGKPLAFGEVGDAFFIGLPGNPVSSFVTFLMFVRPFILRMQGVADVAPLAFLMRADFDWLKPDRRQEYLRARINPAGGLDLFSNQGSGVLTSTVWGDGLIELTPGQTVHSGEQVKFIPFSSF